MFFTPREKLTSNMVDLRFSLGSKYVFGTYVGEKRQVLFFGYIFDVFNGPQGPSRGLWGRVVSRRGKGEV